MSAVSLSRARYLLTFFLFFEAKLTYSEMHKSSGQPLMSFDKCLYPYGINLQLSIEHFQPLQVPSCAFLGNPLTQPQRPPLFFFFFFHCRLAWSNQLLTNTFSPYLKKNDNNNFGWIWQHTQVLCCKVKWTIHFPFSHQSDCLKLFFLLSRWLTYPSP